MFTLFLVTFIVTSSQASAAFLRILLYIIAIQPTIITRGLVKIKYMVDHFFFVSLNKSLIKHTNT